MRVGLRIDVDTFRGTRLGVPNLCRLLSTRSIQATFYFSVGPDNMGRHLWRLLKPAFLFKMLRSKAPGLYGWDILLRGTLGNGPIIGERLADVIEQAADSGHEIGFHAWDHHAWQAGTESMDGESIFHSIEHGVAMLARITGRPPVTSAAPGWICSDRVLLEKSKFPFKYNSDCRGTDIFLPAVDGKPLNQPQVPVTLPTYDEVIGRNGITDDNYNDHILSLLRKDALNVLTIHAEVEGIAKLPLFADFIGKLEDKGGNFVPLGKLLSDMGTSRSAPVVQNNIPGREGLVAVQG
jgi:undecaprenyl phosphate-alpha-L-ara4FN deformylase